MALIDIVKCEVNNNEFIYKYPSDDLRIGTQLVVYPSQTAFFVKGGKICDEFTSGTYTIKTENITLFSCMQGSLENCLVQHILMILTDIPTLHL